VGATLTEQLAEAVRAENYELAAKLRDRIRQAHAASGPETASHGELDGIDHGTSFN
jgi:hypothetical protein